ncbi:MAG: helix-turn-helix transcriptional regulator [Labilithrix sp.]|nr:helix-turn-helix transcriptional regulator [Labilithrix sp.]MCW5812814.1 helix-turn-helix transcriptional regulator [Labilithrix sp.]
MERTTARRLRGFVLDGAEPVYVLEMPRSSASAASGLSAAERAVAELAVAGLSNAAIGARRGTSARTIAAQLASIYRKLGVSSRAELVVTIARGAAE